MLEYCSTIGEIYDIVIEDFPAADAVIHTKYCDVLASNVALSGAGVELVGVEKREYALKTALQPLREQYDYIFIDCPPSLELLTLNALVAADNVIIPMQCEYYALEGIADLMTTIRMCNKRLNPSLRIQGIVMTMYDARTNLTQQVAFELKEYFGAKVYETVIPRSVRLSEAPSHGKPGVAYDRIGKGSRAYMKLADEFLLREKYRKRS